jgi:adenylate cyclase
LGYFIETKKRNKLGQIFGQYIPAELVAEMSQTEHDYSLVAQSKELTVLFSDVRGFTTISESMEPEALSELINEILTPVTKAIHHNKGTIDKYIGDAIMAFWGAPIDDHHHAHNAVKAALEFMPILDVINLEFAQKGWPKIDMGIGINTGNMNVGNMGSEFRMAYTVMGDAVNLGSRLEGLTKHYGVNIIVSEATKTQAPSFLYCELDRV